MQLVALMRLSSSQLYQGANIKRKICLNFSPLTLRHHRDVSDGNVTVRAE
jgi:hypothetical protein